MARVKLTHKIIVAFLVVVLLCSCYGSLVFYQSVERVMDSLARPDPTVWALLVQARKTALIVGVLGVVLGFTVCCYLIRQIASPVAAMVRALEVYLKEKKAVEIRIENKDELGILALYLNEVLRNAPHSEEPR